MSFFGVRFHRKYRFGKKHVIKFFGIKTKWGEFSGVRGHVSGQISSDPTSFTILPQLPRNIKKQITIRNVVLTCEGIMRFKK